MRAASPANSIPTMSDTHTVYVADDHPIFREGLVRAIGQRPDLRLVGEGEDGRAALDDILRLRPDVALLDVRMPGLDGLAVLNALRRDGVDTAVVLLSAALGPSAVYGAVAAGAAAVLTKEADRDEICDAVAAAGRGETRLAAEVQAHLVTEIRRQGAAQRPTLTDREQEVLRLIADGLSAPAIAARLHLSTATVKSHLGTLYDKLSVSDRAAAVATAMRTGLLE